MKKGLLAVILIAVGVSMASCCSPCRARKSVPVNGTKWGLMEMNDKVVERESEGRPERFTLILGDDGRVSGRGDCNTFFAAYSLDNGKIDIANVASTRMMCPEQAMEDQYFRTLEKASNYKIDGDFLILTDADNKIIASFRIVQ